MPERQEPVLEDGVDPWEQVDPEDVYEPPVPEVMPVFPYRVRVKRARYLVGVVLGALGVFGVPWLAVTSWGEGTALFMMYLVVGLVAWPVSLVLFLYSVRAVVLPRHLEIDERGVRTRDWELEWAQVQQVALIPDGWQDPRVQDFPDHKQKVMFQISEQTQQTTIQSRNRWDSGRPFGLGGLPLPNRVVQTQPSTDPPIREAYLVMKELQRRGRAEAGLPSKGLP